ncbi:MAG: GDP-L-fucose synthase [Thermodesulfobacteriota bacterium]
MTAMLTQLTPDTRIYVAGHRGLAGSAFLRRLAGAGYRTLITRTHAELDLTDQQAVHTFFQAERPEVVILAAARVGGILANNTYPADFIYDNLTIQTNVIHAAWRHGVQKLLFLGSSCIYPKHAPQPMREEHLLTGALEPTNEPYAVAKIAGIKMCGAYNRQYGTRFLSVMPTNVYGPGDHYDLETSHVLPALIRKFHLAKLAAKGDQVAIAADERRFGPIPQPVRQALGLEAAAAAAEPSVMLWGTGQARREFLFVDDLADACIFLLERYDPAEVGELVNIGTGEDLTISELASLIAGEVGFAGRVVFDPTMPDGTPRKLLDVSRLTALGWRAHTPLATGLRLTYEAYTQATEPGQKEG